MNKIMAVVVSACVLSACNAIPMNTGALPYSNKLEEAKKCKSLVESGQITNISECGKFLETASK